MKKCKQCGRNLADTCFRKTKSRSKGLRKSAGTGSSTICRDCEALNARAYSLLKRMDTWSEGVVVDADTLRTLADLRKHYTLLAEAGFPPITSAARRLVGLEPLGRHRKVESDAELMVHIKKLRDRSYSSFDEAEEQHVMLVDRLQRAGLYEEANNLLDEWFMEG